LEGFDVGFTGLGHKGGGLDGVGVAWVNLVLLFPSTVLKGSRALK
jgi:hypothetical protein